jgi:hypothetical protein
MTSLQESMSEFRKMLKTSELPHAYRGLMDFMLGLRNYLSQKYAGRFSASSFYQGFMDMSYFAFTPDSLKALGLKVAIVFVYETFRFEVWLAANNKKIQEQYWNIVRESGWDKFRIVPSIQGYDSILEHVLDDDPDFGDPQALMEKIEKGALEFFVDLEKFFMNKKLIVK